MKKKPEPKVLVKGDWLPISQAAEIYGKPLARTSMRLLEKLAEKQEPMAIDALAKELNVTKTYLYSIIKTLEKKGFVMKIGRRRMLIGLLEAGLKQLKQR